MDLGFEFTLSQILCINSKSKKKRRHWKSSSYSKYPQNALPQRHSTGASILTLTGQISSERFLYRIQCLLYNPAKSNKTAIWSISSFERATTINKLTRLATALLPGHWPNYNWKNEDQKRIFLI